MGWFAIIALVLLPPLAVFAVRYFLLWDSAKDVTRDVLMGLTFGLALVTLVSQYLDRQELAKTKDKVEANEKRMLDNERRIQANEQPLVFNYACDPNEKDGLSIETKMTGQGRPSVQTFWLRILPIVIDHAKLEKDIVLNGKTVREPGEYKIGLEIGNIVQAEQLDILNQALPGFDEFMKSCKGCYIAELHLSVKYVWSDGSIKESGRHRTPCTVGSSLQH